MPSRSSRDDAEDVLHEIVAAEAKTFLKRVLDAALAAIRTGRFDGTSPVVALGTLLGWWQDSVSDKVVLSIQEAWQDAFTVTLGDKKIQSPRSEAMAFHIAAVKDRLSRDAQPEIPEAAFDQVRLSQSVAALDGWSTEQQARDIAERLAWEPDKAYWLQAKADADAAIDAILDPLGRPGTPARTYAHKHDPAVKVWQAVRAGAVDKIKEDQGDWIVRSTRIARTECLPASAVVNGARVRAAYRRLYDGEWITVRLGSGEEMTGTPNHPVLTQRGWVGLAELTEHDYLLGHRSQIDEGVTAGDQDVQGRPATIGEVFDALSLTGVLERRPSVRPDFHGDGRDGYVEVAHADSVLLVGDFAAVNERAVEGVLEGADLADVALAAFRSPFARDLLVDQTVDFSACANPRSGLVEDAGDDALPYVELVLKALHRPTHLVLLRDELGGQISPKFGVLDALSAQPRGLRPGATDTSLCNDEFDLPLGETILAGNGRAALPGEVFADKVLSVTVGHFSGHVYNLTTVDGYFQSSHYTANSTAAWNSGALAALVAEGHTHKRWLATEDPRTRDSHRAADGQEVPISQPFKVGQNLLMMPGDPAAPPWETVNCLVDTTVVEARSVRKVYRRPYSGPLVRVRADGVDDLAGTPNHPVLTTRGWVALKDLKPGDGLIGCRFGEDVPSGHPDVEDGPAEIGQVHRALAEQAARVVGVGVQFHGDTGVGDREVDVVDVDGGLWVGGHPALSQPVGEDLFTRGDLAAAGLRLVQHLLSTGPLATAALPSLSQFARPEWDPAFNDAPSYDEPVQVEVATDLLDRIPARVAVHDVFAVDVEPLWHGHVSNLETDAGWYTGSTIITHNCRCTLVGGEALGAMTAGASNFREDQLRVPKGNGGLSGRWMDTPFKILDDLDRDLGEYPPINEGAARYLDWAKDEAKKFDPSAPDLPAHPLDDVFDQMDEAYNRSTGDPARDIIAEARRRVEELAEVDWSLFRSEGDVGGDGPSIADKQASDVGAAPDPADESMLSPAWDRDRDSDGTPRWVNVDGRSVEQVGEAFWTYDFDGEPLLDEPFDTLLEATRAIEDAEAGFSVDPTLFSADESLQDIATRTEDAIREFFERPSAMAALALQQGMTARISQHADKRGLEVRVHRVDWEDDPAEIEWTFHDKETGGKIGSLTRQFTDNGAEVHNDYFHLDEAHQGGGLATALAAELEPWYALNGVQRITVLANIDVGGYTWAKQGFDLDTARVQYSGEGSDTVSGALASLVGLITPPPELNDPTTRKIWQDRLRAKMGGFAIPHGGDDVTEVVNELRARGVVIPDEDYRAMLEDVKADGAEDVIDELLGEWRGTLSREQMDLQDTLEGWVDAVYSDGGYDDLPSMYDLATFGQGTMYQRSEPVQVYAGYDEDPIDKIIDTWPGKAALLGTQWPGVKEIGDGTWR